MKTFAVKTWAVAFGPSAVPAAVPSDADADPVPYGERLVGLAVVAFLVLTLFA